MKAYEVLEQHDWTQGSFARNIRGRCVPVDDETACSFCTSGAIDKAYSDYHTNYQLRFKLEEYLYAKTDNFSIADWNDDPTRTKEEVISVLKELDI